MWRNAGNPGRSAGRRLVRPLVLVAALGTVSALLAAPGSASATAVAPAASVGVRTGSGPSGWSSGNRQQQLERLVLTSLRSAGFTAVIDGDRTFPYPRIAATPNLDVAVIRLDDQGRPREAVNALLSRDYPRGVLAPIGRDLRSDGVRFRAWNLDRFDQANGSTWTTPPFTAADDVVPGREQARIDFMEPYPASSFKLVIAYWVAHLVDQRLLGWGDSYAYDPGPNPPELCAAGARTATIAQFLDTMIAESNNRDTCALIKRLHELNQVDTMNAGLRALGVPALQVLGTDPATGGSWQVGKITVGAFDAAKLLLLIDGAPGTLFRRADGSKVTRSALSQGSRGVLKAALADQGFNEVLATTNWCGHRLPAEFGYAPEYPARGIPTATPQRWLDPDGFATVDGVPYFQDTRPCNAAAQVAFSHKTGLTRNYGSDVGYVHSLPGAPRRDYVITIISNLGDRYTDPVLNRASADPQQGDCWTADFICYSQAFSRFGKAIDDGMVRLAGDN